MKLMDMDHEIIRRLDASFLAGDATLDHDDLLQEFERTIDLSQVEEVVEVAMSRFDRDHAAQSDAWLGPRIHAALRLTRREAGRRGVWRYLAVAVIPHYVRWRWTSAKDGVESPPPLERFVGPDYKHALARLWWMAELFRNGRDYAPAEQALSNQDITNNLFRMDIAHHRPTAQGALVTLSEFREGDEKASGREANALAKAANAAATTLVFDALAMDDPLDEAARELWISQAGEYESSRYLEDLPAGPDDPPVSEASLTSMKVLLDELLEEAPVRGRS